MSTWLVNFLFFCSEINVFFLVAVFILVLFALLFFAQKALLPTLALVVTGNLKNLLPCSSRCFAL